MEKSLETTNQDSEEVRHLKHMVLTFKKKYHRILQDVTHQRSPNPSLEEDQASLIQQHATLKELLLKSRENEKKLVEENHSLKELLKNDQLSEFLSDAKEEFHQIKAELEQTKLRLDVSIKNSIELEFQNQCLLEQKSGVEEINDSELNAARAQNEIIREHLATLQEENNLFKSRLQQAQVHLAKKVKESSSLHDILSSHEKKEMEFVERINQLEAKCVLLTNQCKEAELTIQELSKLEEKHKKLQETLKGFLGS